MILDKLIEKKDLMNYLRLRREHLLLQRQKVKFTVEESKREQASKKLSAKIQELSLLISITNNHEIKDKSKFEFGKVEHLKKVKIAKLKGGKKCK